MKVLFCVPSSLTTRLGKPKVYIEVARALEKQGCTCTLADVDEVAPGIENVERSGRDAYYQHHLKSYIEAHADAFDVIEYEHKHLPYPKNALPSNVLLVARSVLLIHHAQRIQLPVWKGILPLLRNAVGHALAQSERQENLSLRDYAYVLKKHVGTAVRHTFARKEELTRTMQQANQTIHASDVALVSNQHDREVLQETDINPSKIAVLPFGLTKEQRTSLGQATPSVGTSPTIAFIGTFDFRKGAATDIPKIARHVWSEIPKASLRLLGTKGLFVSEKEVRAHFPADMQSQIEAVPSYDPDNLPNLLDGCTLGIFPSYYEGFGFGVLEMLASGLPVFAYDAPGPPEMLDAESLVTRGDWRAMSKKIVALLQDPNELSCRQKRAKQTARAFDWDSIAARTIEVYERYY